FVNLALHLSLQFIFIILNRIQGLDDGCAFDDFFDVITGGFVGIEEHMDFIDAAEKIVQVAHDVLVGAHQEKAELVRLGLAAAVSVEGMKRQGVTNVAEVDELVYLAIGIARNINKGPFLGGTFIKSVDRDDRKKLAKRPMIQQRLEDRKIAQILVAEAVFE